MALTYDDVSRFAKQHGEVKIFPGEGRAVTVLTDGTIDSNTFIEKDAARFEHDGKPYNREQFEDLTRSSSLKQYSRPGRE